MSAETIEQGEDLRLTPAQMSEGAGGLPGTPASSGQTAPSGQDNAGEEPVVGSPAVPGADTVTLTRPLCVDGEFYAGEWETLTVRREQVIGL